MAYIDGKEILFPAKVSFRTECEIVQSAGNSETAVMSQKATTDAINSAKDYITPQMFGAKADGTTDDSEAIRAAIAAVPKKNGVLFFPAGLYIHGDGTTTGLSYPIKSGTSYQPDVTKDTANVGRDIRFYFDGYENLTILGYGAEIRSHDGNGQTRNNAMFIFDNCHRVTIKGLKLNGRRQERKVIQDDYIAGATKDFIQCNMFFADCTCSNITIEDVESINSVHDGISFGWGVNDVNVINCIVDNAQRNGISVCGCKNVSIVGTQCNNTGTSGTNYRGIMPKCGIDIEGHIAEYPNENIYIENCSFENNVAQGTSISNNTRDVFVKKCYYKNNRANVMGGSVDRLYISDSTLINSRMSAGFTLIENNYIEICNSSQLSDNKGYSFDSADNDRSVSHEARNNTFKFVIDNESAIVSGDYMGIRADGNMRFIGNRVIDTFSTGGFSASMLSCYAEGNTFERNFTALNGISVTDYNVSVSEIHSSGQMRKDNKFIGIGYTCETNDFNSIVTTDTSIKKSYAFLGSVMGKIFKVNAKGVTKINIFYQGQEEEIIIPTMSHTAARHILKHKTKSVYMENSKIATLRLSYPDWYIVTNVPYPRFTVTVEADYVGTKVEDTDFLVDVTGTVSADVGYDIQMTAISGHTNDRATYGNREVGEMFFDTVQGKPIWWNGEKWVDSTGAAV